MLGLRMSGSRAEHADRLSWAARSRRSGMFGIAAHFIASAREERLEAKWST